MRIGRICPTAQNDMDLVEETATGLEDCQAQAWVGTVPARKVVQRFRRIFVIASAKPVLECDPDFIRNRL